MVFCPILYCRPLPERTLDMVDIEYPVFSAMDINVSFFMMMQS